MDVTAIIIAVIGSGFLNTMIVQLFDSRRKKRESESGVQQATRLLMKDRLRHLCVYYIQQGWIYEDELDDLMSMHKCYHDDLKGNGFLDSQMRRVNALEVRGIGVR